MFKTVSTQYKFDKCFANLVELNEIIRMSSIGVILAFL